MASSPAPAELRVPVRERHDVLFVSASDANYFPLLADLVESLNGIARHLAILDLGLAPEQSAWLRDRRIAVERPEWHVDFPGRNNVPDYFKAMCARPYLPDYFPGYGIYLWLDSDAWVQDPSVLDWFVDGATRHQLAIVPELDRSYWTVRKPPKLWGQNQKAFAWSYGAKVGYRLGRNPILNSGAFALLGDAPHWAAWAEAHRSALTRTGFRAKPGTGNLYFHVSEQTALNKVVFGDRLPATLLPAIANWFCGKGTPWWDEERRLLIEPNVPYTALGVVHLAGTGAKDRIWELPVVQGGLVSTRLRRSDVLALRRPDPARTVAEMSSSPA